MAIRIEICDIRKYLEKHITLIGSFYKKSFIFFIIGRNREYNPELGGHKKRSPMLHSAANF